MSKAFNDTVQAQAEINIITEQSSTPVDDSDTPILLKHTVDARGLSCGIKESRK